MMEHKHAKLLRMAADNADQLFECDDDGFYPNGSYKIESVLIYPGYNWLPVKTTKKIKRWLWADKHGRITERLFTELEVTNRYARALNEYTTKLLWSETEFEVEK